MLGASLAMLVLVSAFVAFGSWPGEKAGKQIDQVLLNEVSGAKGAQKVAVGTAAIKANRRAEIRQRVAIAKAERDGRGRGGDRASTDPIARTPGTTGGETTAAGTPVASAPGDSSPASTVRQQTQNVTQGVQNTTDTVKNTTDTVTNQVQQQVDQTTTQVNQVVDQVVGGVEQTTQTTTQQVQNTVDNTTKTVTDTVGGVLGK